VAIDESPRQSPNKLPVSTETQITGVVTELAARRNGTRFISIVRDADGVLALGRSATATGFVWQLWRGSGTASWTATTISLGDFIPNAIVVLSPPSTSSVVAVGERDGRAASMVIDRYGGRADTEATFTAAETTAESLSDPHVAGTQIIAVESSTYGRKLTSSVDGVTWLPMENGELGDINAQRLLVVDDGVIVITEVPSGTNSSFKVGFDGSRTPLSGLDDTVELRYSGLAQRNEKIMLFAQAGSTGVEYFLTGNVWTRTLPVFRDADNELARANYVRDVIATDQGWLGLVRLYDEPTTVQSTDGVYWKELNVAENLIDAEIWDAHLTAIKGGGLMWFEVGTAMFRQDQADMALLDQRTIPDSLPIVDGATYGMVGDTPYAAVRSRTGRGPRQGGTIETSLWDLSAPGAALWAAPGSELRLVDQNGVVALAGSTLVESEAWYRTIPTAVVARRPSKGQWTSTLLANDDKWTDYSSPLEYADGKVVMRLRRHRREYSAEEWYVVDAKGFWTRVTTPKREEAASVWWISDAARNILQIQLTKTNVVKVSRLDGRKWVETSTVTIEPVGSDASMTNEDRWNSKGEKVTELIFTGSSIVTAELNGKGLIVSPASSPRPSDFSELQSFVDHRQRNASIELSRKDISSPLMLALTVDGVATERMSFDLVGPQPIAWSPGLAGFNDTTVVAMGTDKDGRAFSVEAQLPPSWTAKLKSATPLPAK
jgi:hypothetical protein